MKKQDDAMSGLKKKFGVSDFIIGFVLLLVALVSFIPFWHILVCSFAKPSDIADSSFLLIPKSFSLDTLKYIMSAKSITKALVNSIFITAVGTGLSLGMTALMAYPLSRPNLKGRNGFMFFIVLTMVFNPGMIPNFLNVKDMGLYNSIWSMMIPTMIGAYNLVLVKNFYQSLPDSLVESAKIDGANDLVIFIKLFLPLSKPILATVALFYAVGYWNNYLSAILYVNDPSKWPIQVLLRNIVLLAQTDLGSESGSVISTGIDLLSLRSATILISTVPILCVYPFAQKYFTKGIMLGSVKG